MVTFYILLWFFNNLVLFHIDIPVLGFQRTVVWRRLLRVPWTERRSNQPILKEISPEYSLEGLMLKLKLHYFGHLMQRTGSLKNTLMLGKNEGRRRRDDRGWDGWKASPTQWIWVWVSSGSWWWTGKPGVLQSMGSQRVRHDCATELNWNIIFPQYHIWNIWYDKIICKYMI